MSGRRLGDARGDRLLHVGDRARAEELHRGEVRGGEDLMQVRVDEAGHDRAAGEIDRLRRGAGELANLLVAADGDEASVADRDCLGDAPAGVDGEDAAVAENEIGVLRRGELRKSKNGENSECDANARREAQHGDPPRWLLSKRSRERNFGKAND